MKQKVITPDCPRCHGALWSVPCPLGEGCEHFECTECGVEWVYRGHEWIRFDDCGQVLEVLPPRVPRFSLDTLTLERRLAKGPGVPYDLR